MNEEFDKLRDVNVKKTVNTAKRPIGILRHNAELPLKYACSPRGLQAQILYRRSHWLISASLHWRKSAYSIPYYFTAV